MHRRTGTAAGALCLLLTMLAPSAHAAVSCTVSGAEVEIVVTGANQDTVLTRQGQTLKVDDDVCQGATMDDIDRIVVKEQTTDGGLNLHVDLSGGLFEPGATPEADGSSEVEIVFEFGTQEDDYDSIGVIGTSDPDEITIGDNGASYTTDGDADIEFDGDLPALRSRGIGEGGADIVSSRGGRGTGPGVTYGTSLFGGDGADQLLGGPGGDFIEGGEGPDIVDGGPDYGGYVVWDAAVYSSSPSGVNVNLASGIGTGGDAEGDTIIGIDSAFGSEFDDTLIGDDADNALIDGNGSDTLSGAGGNDFLDGGQAGDNLDGGDGLDWAQYYSSDAGLSVNLAEGTVSGGTATGDSLTNIENITGTEFADTMVGDENENLFEGGRGDDNLTGAGGDDWLIGDLGDDVLRGEEGNDYLPQPTAVDGEDVIDGGPGDGDTVDYYGRESVAMSSDGIANDGDPGEKDNITDVEVLWAGDGDDVITGGGAKDRLKGRGGDDRLDGLGQNDRLRGDDGTDDVAGSGGNDTLLGNGGGDELSGGKGNDTLNGGPGDDVLNGGPGHDVCVVDSKNDQVKSCEVKRNNQR